MVEGLRVTLRGESDNSDDWPAFSFGWQSSAPATNQLQFTHLLTQDEFARFETAASLAASATSSLFGVLVDNWKALEGYLDALAGLRPRQRRGTPFPGPYERVDRLLRDLTNYLSSTRMWVDSTSDSVSRLWGRMSAPYEEFRNDLARAFDTSIGYRFTYHLRNALQHIQGLPISLSVSDDEHGKPRVSVIADAAVLVRSYEWHAHVKKDLLAGPATIDVIALLRDGFDAIVEVEHRRIERHFVGSQAGLSALLDLHRSSPIPDDAIPLLMAVVGRRNGALELVLVGVPTRATLVGLMDAQSRGGAVPFLKSLEQRPVPRSVALPANWDLTRGLAESVVQAWFRDGPNGAQNAMQAVIESGPNTAHHALVGMLNLVTEKLSTVELLMGPTVAEQVANLSGPMNPANPASDTALNGPA